VITLAPTPRFPPAWVLWGLALLLTPSCSPTQPTQPTQPAQSGQAPAPPDAEAIGRAADVKATVSPDGVVRISWARTDVPVMVDGMPLRPFAGLASWAAFKATPHGAMMMGDEVVFADEVAPAMDAAFAAGLEVTALHNHFLHDEPRVSFMHIGGTGDAARLAEGVKDVWDAIRKVRAASAQPATRTAGPKPAPGTITAGTLEAILGHKCDTQDGVVKVTIGRQGRMHGEDVGGSMGLTTWAAFSGSDDLAAVDGDFIMAAGEVQSVLRALRRADLQIVALHHHMIEVEPAFYFTHFWGTGPAETLARGIRAALDEQQRASGR
jgi:hypothetical protein